jgi:hypothetical protein
MSLLDTASLILTPNGYKASKLYSVKPTDATGDMVVSRATTATRVNSAGLIESVAIDVPRLDYTGDGCPKILVEPLRTNLVLRSQEFDNASWGKVGANSGIAPVVTANAGTAPDGTMTADRVEFNCVESLIADRSYIVQSLVTTIGTRYYQSIYVKAFSSDQVGKQLRIAADGLTSLSLVITITADWQRIVLNGLANDTTTYFLVETRGTFTTNKTADVLLWGAQLEAGSNETSYIPTTTATVTRSADVISKTGISSLIGQTQGTLYAEINISTFNSGRFLTISDGTSANRIEMYKFTDNKIYCDRIAATQSVATSIGSSALSVGTYKVAFAYQSGTSYLYINGAQVGATSAATFTFGSMGKVNIGSRYDDTSTFNDRVELATLFPTRLTNAQLATLTTL